MFNLEKAENEIKQKLNLSVLIDQSENYIITCEKTALQALSMSLQARKIKNQIELSRKEIVRPHIDFQKSIGKLVNDLELKIESIEGNLKDKLDKWLESQEKDDLTSMMYRRIEVEDGTLTKSSKWQWELVDISIVPRQFLMIDESAVEQAVKNGLRKVPGIKIEQIEVTTLRVKN